MKLVSYLRDNNEQLAFLIDGMLYDCDLINPDLPAAMSMFLNFWDDLFPLMQQTEEAIRLNNLGEGNGVDSNEVQLLSPVPFPASCRDGYAFRQHVATARRNRKVPMVGEFDQYPVFYFTNHNSIQGAGDILCMPDHFHKLDFELEAAIVICKTGRNIPAAEAGEYIGGLMIMNDMSARTLQMEEMLLNLGPAKGKDFATAVGPCLVTLDELEQYEVLPKEGHTGKSWNLPMSCTVNGIQVSKGNMGDMDWTFAEIVERCSYGVTLNAGDIIGSGTVGTGCFLELNGTGKLNNPDYKEQWLQEGDTIEMEITGIGILKNKIVKEESDFSILDKKLNQQPKG